MKIMRKIFVCFHFVHHWLRYFSRSAFFLPRSFTVNPLRLLFLLSEEKTFTQINNEVDMRHRKPCSTLRRTKFFVMLATMVLSLAGLAPLVSAEEEPDEDRGWEFQVAPYFWFVSIDGDVTVKGRESDVDADFSDVWDELNIAGKVSFEARKGNWGFLGDVLYADLGKERSVGPFDIDPTVKLMWVTAGGSYRLGTWKLSDAAGKDVPAVTVDSLFGARYTHLDVNLDIKGFPNRSGNQDWLDPLVGARALFDLSEHWTLSLLGNVGGFGVGSDFTWETLGGIGYRFRLFSKENNARAFGGYRAVYQDYTDGSGNDKFEWDVTLHGPILGLVIAF